MNRGSSTFHTPPLSRSNPASAVQPLVLPSWRWQTRLLFSLQLWRCRPWPWRKDRQWGRCPPGTATQRSRPEGSSGQLCRATVNMRLGVRSDAIPPLRSPAALSTNLYALDPSPAKTKRMPTAQRVLRVSAKPICIWGSPCVLKALKHHPSCVLALGFSDLQAEVKLQGYFCHFTSQELWKDTVPRTHGLQKDSGWLSGLGYAAQWSRSQDPFLAQGEPRQLSPQGWDPAILGFQGSPGGSDAQGGLNILPG